jgi:hypothetical protein
MSDEKPDFLRRWSRLKREAAAAPGAGNLPATAAKEESEKSPPLPSLDSLSFESDFKAFMHSKVEQGVKRAALKKLFADPRFNVMDGLDTYIDDYSKEDPIPQAMMATLEHARQTLFGPKEEEKAQEQEKEQTPTEQPQQARNEDVDPAQDPKAL